MGTKHDVEALLFSSGKTMTLDQIAELAKASKTAVKRALNELQKEYAKREGAIEIIDDGDSWKMAVRNAHLPLVQNIVADTELTRACMETLAVIAYQYPNILQSEVVETRGSNAYEHIKELEHLGFIKKTPEGRTYKISLTEKFFEYFDVQGEKDIRKVFKKVKVPEKVGEMEVVDIEEPEEKPMEVVEVAEKPEKPSVAHREYLDDLDARISAIKDRNDNHAEDPLLQREEPEDTTEEES